tara:strand:+ start:155 stop:739 length:585 start_codon:yes stop_codon:yes gene_type:complete
MAQATNLPARNVKGNVSPQEKILYVANKLGISSLKYMQGTTRVIYDQSVTAATNHTLFEGAAGRDFPLTNLGANGNQFQVDEALLVEQIAFFVPDAADGQNFAADATNSFIFDLIIGNKTVMKDVVVETAGQGAFYNGASKVVTLEGVGILIPPQVEFKLNVRPLVTKGRAAASIRCGSYLFGTGVLLNFNTTI